MYHNCIFLGQTGPNRVRRSGCYHFLSPGADMNNANALAGPSSPRTDHPPLFLPPPGTYALARSSVAHHHPAAFQARHHQDRTSRAPRTFSPASISSLPMTNMFGHVLPSTRRTASRARLPRLPRRSTREKGKRSTPASLYHKHRTPILQVLGLWMAVRMMRQAERAKRRRKAITRLSSGASQVRKIHLSLLSMLLIFPATGF
jgi:hypothetical protein